MKLNAKLMLGCNNGLELQVVKFTSGKITYFWVVFIHIESEGLISLEAVLGEK